MVVSATTVQVVHDLQEELVCSGCGTKPNPSPSLRIKPDGLSVTGWSAVAEFWCRKCGQQNQYRRDCDVLA